MTAKVTDTQIVNETRPRKLSKEQKFYKDNKKDIEDYYRRYPHLKKEYYHFINPYATEDEKLLDSEDEEKQEILKPTNQTIGNISSIHGSQLYETEIFSNPKFDFSRVSEKSDSNILDGIKIDDSVNPEIITAIKSLKHKIALLEKFENDRKSKTLNRKKPKISKKKKFKSKENDDINFEYKMIDTYDISQIKKENEYTKRLNRIYGLYNENKLWKVDALIKKYKFKLHKLYVKVCEKNNLKPLEEYNGNNDEILSDKMEERVKVKSKMVENSRPNKNNKRKRRRSDKSEIINGFKSRKTKKNLFENEKRVNFSTPKVSKSKMNAINDSNSKMIEEENNSKGKTNVTNSNANFSTPKVSNNSKMIDFLQVPETPKHRMNFSQNSKTIDIFNAPKKQPKTRPNMDKNLTQFNFTIPKFDINEHKTNSNNNQRINSIFTLQKRTENEYRKRFNRIYSQYNKEKLTEVNSLISKYRFRLHELYIKICNKYKLKPLEKYTGNDNILDTRIEQPIESNNTKTLLENLPRLDFSIPKFDISESKTNFNNNFTTQENTNNKPLFEKQVSAASTEEYTQSEAGDYEEEFEDSKESSDETNNKQSMDLDDNKSNEQNNNNNISYDYDSKMNEINEEYNRDYKSHMKYKSDSGTSDENSNESNSLAFLSYLQSTIDNIPTNNENIMKDDLSTQFLKTLIEHSKKNGKEEIDENEESNEGMTDENFWNHID